MIPASIAGHRHRIAAVYQSLRCYHFPVTVEQIAADVRNYAGLDLHPKTVSRDLRLLECMGLARPQHNCKAWVYAAKGGAG